jgi:fluoride ion exporter CrcB/FEX
VRLERETVPGMDPISFRMRHLLAFVVVAGITAAVLRHFFHVDVGLSREEIRTGALIAATVAIFLVVVLFRRKRRP